MTTQTEALKLALEALEKIREADTAGATPKQITEVRKLYEPTITAIKEALAQPEQEPVGLQWLAAMILSDCGCSTNNERLLERVIARIYRYERANSSPQRTWVGLTDEEINKVLGGDIHDEPNGLLEFVRAIEAKLKEKNT